MNNIVIDFMDGDMQIFRNVVKDSFKSYDNKIVFTHITSDGNGIQEVVYIPLTNVKFIRAYKEEVES